MMDSEGQWEYVVDKVWICARAKWPRYPELFMISCRWQTVSCAAWALRERRPYPRSSKLYLIRYRAVARLQLTHFLCPDTTPRVVCLCDCPFCVTVTITTCAFVTFHIESVCTVKHVMGARLKSLTRDNFFGELRSTTLPRKASLHSNTIFSPCSRRCRQYKLRFKTTATPRLRQRTPDSHPHRCTRRVRTRCIHAQTREGGAYWWVNKHTPGARQP
jgi:hypothetical protein